MLRLRVSSGAATAALIAAGFLVCAAIDLPGHLSYDSIVQLSEGRSGVYGNWHPPLMSWLLGVFDAVLPGTALFMLFDMALLFGSLAALLWLSRARAWAGAVVLLVGIATPQFVLYQGIVWKDVLFANLSIAGFAALALAGEGMALKRVRVWASALAMAFLVLAALVRQNGAVVLPFGIMALAWIAWRRNPANPPRASLISGCSALVGASLGVIGIHTALATRVSGNPSPTVQFRLLEFYDLIGALHRDPALELPQFDDDDPDLEQAMRTDGVRLYTPARNDTLVQSARLQKAYFASPDETIPEEWQNLIREHTALYLQVRADVFRWVFLTPDLPACRPVYTGVSGPAPQMAALGVTPRLDARDRALNAYASFFEDTPFLSHATFAVLAFAMIVVFLRRRRNADIAMASLLLSAFAFAASFFVVAIACDYRYLYMLDLATLVATYYLALDWRSAWKALRYGASASHVRV